MSLAARISERLPGLLQASTAVLLFLCLAMPARSQAFDEALYSTGEKLFKGNCGSCHKPDKNLTGPAIAGSRARWEGQGDIYAWIKNSTAYLKTGNAYANKLFADWKGSVMTAQAVTDEEIDAILYYADNYPGPQKAGTEPPPPTPPSGPTDAGDAWPWMVALALLFLVVAISLGGVKKSLDNAVRESEGREPAPDLTFGQRIGQWAWNNKIAASLIGLFVVVWLLLQGWNALWVIGVYGGDEVANYKPEQPILFNHTLHAGKVEAGNLAINCQYCHSSAEKSKHAGIPSANICMNCHQAVGEGRSAAGTAEIAKIYKAVGWDPENLAYTGEEEPIRWVKVHNLPDHAYFNHAQHVAVGKIECQECHGPIDEKMDVAEQWAPLTMGWCIDCHGQREVNMAGNGYYDETMARLMETDLGHKELKKYLEDDKITVKELGGWECAKCHY
jgi:mono/diheme cytochrome c family protein